MTGVCAYDASQNGIIYTPGCAGSGLSVHELTEEYWDLIEDWTIPEQAGLFNNGYVGTPDLYSNQYSSSAGNSRSGEFWQSTAKEFTVIELDEPLEPDTEYFIEIFYQKEENGPATISAYDRFPKHKDALDVVLEDNNKKHYENILTIEETEGSYDEWIRFAAFFTVSEEMPWISVGGDGMFEDIKIYKVPGLCADQWYFDNTEFNYPHEIFQAGNFIKAGEGVDPEAGQLHGPVTVKTGTYLILKAGNSVVIGPNFIMEPNSELEVYIEPCSNICPQVDLISSILPCVSSPVEIGFPDLVNTFTQFQWSPSTNLDDPNSPNPIFTPPGGNGLISYNVTYSAECATSSYSVSGNITVDVYYNDGTNGQPTVSTSNVNFDDYNFYMDINVNDYVDIVTVSYYSPTHGQIEVDFQRDIDFNGSVIPFNFYPDGLPVLLLANTAVSCCAPTEFTITAENTCGPSVSTTVLWDKGGPITMTNTPQTYVVFDNTSGLPYLEEYCFSSENACYFKFHIEPSNGSSTVEYDEEGYIFDATTCLDWQGQTNNGNQMLQGNYTVVLELFNDCGESFDDHEDFGICYGTICPAGLAPEYYDLDYQNGKSDPNEIPIAIVATGIEGKITIQDFSQGEKAVSIYSTTGQLVHNSTFIDFFEFRIASGLYFFHVKDGDGNVLVKRIMVTD